MIAIVAALALAAPPCTEHVGPPSCAPSDWTCLSPALTTADAARRAREAAQCEASVQLARDEGEATASLLRRELAAEETARAATTAACLVEVDGLRLAQGHSGWTIAGWTAGGLVVGAVVGAVTAWALTR